MMVGNAFMNTLPDGPSFQFLTCYSAVSGNNYSLEKVAKLEITVRLEGWCWFGGLVKRPVK